MVQLKTILLPVLGLIGASAASNVKDLTPSTFKDEVFNGVPSLVEFFAPWCGHCKKLAPIYEELADSFVSKKINIAKVDADEHKSLGTDYGIQGFPTIKFFDGKSEKPIDYSGGRDLESFQTFIQEKTGVKAKKAAAAPSEVVHATDSTFGKLIGKDQSVFVAFTAPWCGHCKTLAPEWEKLAYDFAPEESVVIAKVDAEANKGVASKYGVKSYPTIKFFPKGSTEPIEYDGSRVENSLVKFVNEKAETHRAPGGGLDAAAGTIVALDSIISKLTGSNGAELYEEAHKAAKGLKDLSAEYYVKVLQKTNENKDYAQKELIRLQGILKKGGLARANEDKFSTRANILKKFVQGEKSFEAVKEEL
ncbi:hypothetical protein FH972_024414 [Carpinus fangiana]|uniref:protein disulfide-isomerase n=1 Tax=Carpinus fangiana TaxID=176857 RepID=A0A5N6KYV8_9ROSI|nr:hypothetical protein FH972_024414 [Carpinus fangiana]